VINKKSTLFVVAISYLMVTANVSAGSMEDMWNEFECTNPDTGELECGNQEPAQPPPEPRVIIKEVPVSAPVTFTPPPRPQPQPQSPVVNNATKMGAGNAFEFKSCQLFGNELECHFNITSQQFDRTIQPVKTLLYDNLGNEYPNYKIKLGNKLSEHLNSGFRVALIADVTTPAVFYFKNISSQATSISKLAITSRANKTGHRTWDNFTITYRKLPFTKGQ